MLPHAYHQLLSYNTLLVAGCALFLGAAAGLVGCFIFLQRKTLIADALAHAALPGIGIGFLLSLMINLSGVPYSFMLLIFSFIAAALGAACIAWLTGRTRLREDAAIAFVLSVFYGAGIALLSYIQRIEGASQAGLDQYLLGQIAGTGSYEATFIVVLSAICMAFILLFFKDFTLISFDAAFARSTGYPGTFLNFLLMGLALTVICAGIKIAGAVLILSLIVCPAAFARLWADKIQNMAILSAGAGAACALIGALLSALVHNLPTGATIVLVCLSLYVLSLCLKAVIRYLKRSSRVAEGKTYG